jgi:hypothetical protein
MLSFTRVSGNTLAVVDVGLNRIGTEKPINPPLGENRRCRRFRLLCRQVSAWSADSDEAARLKRDDCAQGFLDDAAPL